jgi:hypothetical protein
MDKLYEKAETGCCQRFDPKPWNMQEVVFENKLFLKDRVKSFLHIPLNMNQIMVKNMEIIKQADALPEKSLMLFDENSLWGSDIYIHVAKEIPEVKMVKLSGTYLTKVYEGSYQQMGSWIKDMTAYVKNQGKTLKKLYFFYTTCPACAKYYGQNYTVILAQV